MSICLVALFACVQMLFRNWCELMLPLGMVDPHKAATLTPFPFHLLFGLLTFLSLSLSLSLSLRFS